MKTHILITDIASGMKVTIVPCAWEWELRNSTTKFEANVNELVENKKLKKNQK